MELQNNVKPTLSPLMQLLYLSCFAIAGLFIGVIIGFVVALAVYGTDLLKDMTWLSGANPRYFGAVKIIITAQQLGLFLAPALMLAAIEGKKPLPYYQIKKWKAPIVLLVLALMVCSMPIMSWINEWNQKMVFPDFLKDLENWMRQMEDEALKTTEAILTMNSYGDFFIALFVIALVPAVCEEFFFRGALQGIFVRWIKNPHIAIWLGAIVFSAFHFQFYGFIPRLILGSVFGYMYFWSKNLWYPIIAHFLNNAFAVCFAWYYQLNNLGIKSNDEIPVAWYGYMISLVLSLALLKYFKDQTTKINPEKGI